MTLRKLTIDNSVRYIPTTEQIKEKMINQKLLLFLVKKTKTFHKIVKNLLMILQQEDLEYLQNSMYLYRNIYIIIRI